MLLIGYFERIDSERGICWRCSDSLSLRQFLGLGMEERTPDHSSLSRIRNRLPLEVHESVFGWVLEVLASRGMIDGKTLGVDATTLEANAALRSIVRRDTGESYESYLKELARKSGIEEPSRADIAKLDKKRPKKGSNKEWVNPNEPDAEIMKMKSGGTDMAHKAEHAVDMSGEGAVIAVTLHGGAKGDTKSLPDTLEKAQSNLQELANNAECCERIHEDAGREVVGDKGYHGNDILVELVEQEYRSYYISEPERGGRKWKDKQAEQAATYANRRRIRGTRGKRLIRRRGELLERPFAHYLEAGGMRRTHLRRHENILKRLLTHVAGFNLGILMRNLIGKATPKEYAELNASLIAALLRCLDHRRTFCPAAIHRVSLGAITSSLNLPTLSPAESGLFHRALGSLRHACLGGEAVCLFSLVAWCQHTNHVFWLAHEGLHRINGRDRGHPLSVPLLSLGQPLA